MSKEKLFKSIGFFIHLSVVIVLLLILVYFIFSFFTMSLYETGVRILIIFPVITVVFIISLIGDKIWDIGEKERMKV